MKVGDPFIRHTAYCFQVLEGARRGEFNDKGQWPSQQPADVDEPSQINLVAQLQRWRDLAKKYAGIAKHLDPRELFILAIAVQRWQGPVLELGTHRGVSTCLIAEVLNALRRSDLLYTVETFKEGVTGPMGEDDYPGEHFLKAIKEFRSQPALDRVVPIVGDSHRMKNLFFGMHPAIILLDGDSSEEGVLDDLTMLSFFNHPFVCLVHNANVAGVMRSIQAVRQRERLAFANFHTGTPGQKGLAALSRP